MNADLLVVIPEEEDLARRVEDRNLTACLGCFTNPLCQERAQAASGGREAARARGARCRVTALPLMNRELP
jgi:hypothetical protein